MGAYSESASLDIESLQNIILAIAESESVEAVLRTVVHGLTGQPDVALTRIGVKTLPSVTRLGERVYRDGSSTIAVRSCARTWRQSRNTLQNVSSRRKASDPSAPYR